jgi:uncharacterized protein (TIGR01619 family)
VAEHWDSYFTNVNGVLASIALDLEIRKSIPDPSKPNLLWIWVYMESPREDGLSSDGEFEALCAIEDCLTKVMADRFGGVFCGRITTDGRREFYYYASSSDQLEAVVKDAMGQFRDYEFDCGSEPDPKWAQYLNVLYPSDEDRQRMENRHVLDVLERKGDTLQKPRDVWHWIYFRDQKDREEFRDAVTQLEYRLQSNHTREDSEFPIGICIVRFQSVKLNEIDDAVIELFRLANMHNGDYDGWETKVILERQGPD